MLLSRVCQDAQKAGFDVIKGYPNKEFLNTEQGFIGLVKLYENYGFAACCETDKKLVMRKNYGNSKLLPFPVNRHSPCFIISVSGRPVSGYLPMRELAADNS